LLNNCYKELVRPCLTYIQQTDQETKHPQLELRIMAQPIENICMWAPFQGSQPILKQKTK